MTTVTTGRKLLWIAVAFALAAALVVATGTPASAAPPTFAVEPGVELVTVTGAVAGTELTLSQVVGTNETRLLTLRADYFGQAVFAYIPPRLPNGTPQILNSWAPEAPTLAGGGTVAGTSTILRPGAGYYIRDNTKTPAPSFGPFTVMAKTDTSSSRLDQPLNGIHWDTLLQRAIDGEQTINGFNYIEMRDKVKLSAMVRFPDSRVFGKGPYPTVVEYSGYDPSSPDGITLNAQVALLLGFAVVGVNVRGSGCSGGALDVFTAAQQADGYDVIEVVARQTWARKRVNGTGGIGMVGLSYPGIMQLYVAATNPPNLAAITPMSVTGDLWGGMWPGGVLNTGFSGRWLQAQEQTNAAFGLPWVTNRANAGDPTSATCTMNQLMRAQNIDLTAEAEKLPTRPAELDARDLTKIVPRINVPVYLSGAWQDEQTGSAFADMIPLFKPDIPKRFVMYNGHHPDGYAPANLSRWYEFLQLYVANQIPSVPASVRLIAPLLSGLAYGMPADVNLDPDRFTWLPSSCFSAATPDCMNAARFVFQSENKVEVRADVGAARADAPGTPVPMWTTTLPNWPPSTSVGTWYLQAGGKLSTAAPTTPASAVPGASPSGGVDSFSYDPTVGPTAYGSANADDKWIKPTPQLQMDWKPTPEGKGVSYLTEPLTQDTVIAGSGHVDLWFASQGTDAEIEVVLSEVTDSSNNETRIQNGVVRAGFRAVDPARSTATHIELKYRAGDLAPLTPNAWNRVKVPILPVAHVLRAGSRLRLQINTPGGDLPKWSFVTHPYGTGNPRQAIGRTVAQPSALVLPLLAGGGVAPRQPWQQCAMRGEPCRQYTVLPDTGV
jgi:predicted acyl esterase